jgi:hypothetical protein
MKIVSFCSEYLMMYLYPMSLVFCENKACGVITLMVFNDG